MIRKLTGPTLAPSSGAAPRQLVVLLHGYGSNGADLISLAPLWRAAMPDAMFIAPDAPEPCPGAPGGRQWWALSELTPQALGAGAARAAPALDNFLDETLAEHGLAEDRLLLVGFSQGTMMALHVAPRRARAVAGVIGYSGMLAGPAPRATDILSKPPMLLVHGSADPLVPVARHREAQAALHRLGFEVETHVSQGLGHLVDATGLQLGAAFAKRVLGIA